MGYFIFCVVTAFIATLFLFKPVLSKLKESNPNHNIVLYSWISYPVFFIITILIAPITFLATIVPGTSVVYQDALFASMNSDLN